MIIIGITGTLGAGKGAVVDYLVKEKGFAHFSARAFIQEEILRRGLPVNRDTMTVVANDMRATHSPSYVAQELYKRAQALDKNAVIESLRTLGEVEFLRNKGGFYLIAVDVDPKERYQRITLRDSETDWVSYKKFLNDEEKEMESQDPRKQNIRGCIGRADYIIENNGSFSELAKKVEKALYTFGVFM